MVHAREQGFWKGFVYGIVTPMALALGVTIIGMIAVAVGSRRGIGD